MIEKELEEIQEKPLEKYKDLPQYVLKLFNQHGFEDMFLMNNPRYESKGYIERLPDFGTLETDKEYWNGKMFWRYVGWGIGKKYTGEDLRAIRKKNGVGRIVKKESNEKV